MHFCLHPWALMLCTLLHNRLAPSEVPGVVGLSFMSTCPPQIKLKSFSASHFWLASNHSIAYYNPTPITGTSMQGLAENNRLEKSQQIRCLCFLCHQIWAAKELWLSSLILRQAIVQEIGHWYAQCFITRHGHNITFSHGGIPFCKLLQSVIRLTLMNLL